MHNLHSQSVGNSPYSRFGIGDLLPEGNVRNFGIGGAGTALPDFRFINFNNPALLSFNKVVGFEGGFLYQYKRIESEFESQAALGAIPSFGVFAFPIHKRYTMSVGIRPVSIIDFQRRYTQVVEGDTSAQLFVNERGSGGLNTVFLSNGVEISKNLSLGAEFSYTFGRREVESTFGLDGIDPFLNNVLIERENYRGFGYKLGAFYSLKLDSAGKSAIGLGLTYKGQTNLNTDVFISSQFQASSLALTEDTFLNEDFTTRIPQTLNFGIAYKRANSWGISADIDYTPWSQYVSNFANPNSRNVLNYRLGFELVPNYRSVTSIFARSIYRLGLYYSPFPFEPEQGSFEEFGMNIGLSMPIKKINYLNLGLSLGRRGTLENSLILENFARVTFSLTINDPTWFRRYKLD